MGNDILQSKAGRDKPRKVTGIVRNYDDDLPLPWMLTRMICQELPGNLKIMPVLPLRFWDYLGTAPGQV